MKLESINKDIQSLEKCLKIIEQTENYMHFNKSSLILDLCEQINVLKEKRDRQIEALKSLRA